MWYPKTRRWPWRIVPGTFTSTYLQLLATLNIIWTVTTTSQLEKPRYLIIGSETNRKTQPAVTASHFYHSSFENVDVYLNSQCNPYGNLNRNFGTAQLALLWEMHAHFQASYYDKEAGPLLSCAEFRDHMRLWLWLTVRSNARDSQVGRHWCAFGIWMSR